MVKPHPILLLATVVIGITGCSISPFAVQAAADVSPNSELELDAIPRRARPDGIRRAINEFQQTFNQRRPRKEGIRRGGLCALSPATEVLQKNYVIWSDRPLFLWKVSDAQTAVQRVRVLQVGTDEIVWEKVLQPGDAQTLYSGKPLQPGQVYSWELTFQRNRADAASQEVLEYRFQVMPATQRNQVTTQLQALTTKLQSEGVTREEMALQQARYLADQELLSDAIQVLYTLTPASPEITDLLQKLADSVCQDATPTQ